MLKIIAISLFFFGTVFAQPMPEATPIPTPTAEETIPPDLTRQMTDEEMEQTTGEPATSEDVERWKARYRAASYSNNWWRLIPPPYPYKHPPIPAPAIHRHI